MLKHAKLLESAFRLSVSPRVDLKYPLEVEGSRLPYSKSHARRLKRKAKEELAGGTLSDIQSAIAAMESDEKTSGEELLPESSKNGPFKPPAKKLNTGLIGEGKGTPLSQNQRKNALYAPYFEPKDCADQPARKLERMRHPMIIANSDFKANPFRAIRTHAQNTLVKNASPSQPS